jgi:protein-tyrosine phosphatase
MRHLLAREGLTDRVHVESAGTGGWHVGEAADSRAIAHAKRRGIVLDRQAQQVTSKYFERFDLFLAADGQNLAAVRRLAPREADRAKVQLLRSFEPGAAPGAEVPDPYAGGAAGFEEVLDICEAACAGLLEHLRETYDL